MRLWLVWWSVIEPLREVCARQASFLWLAMTTAGICARGDLLGVSSIVRTLGLAGRCYDRLPDFFHSPAVDPDRLSRKWTQQAMGLFPAYRYAGRPVLLGDGIKIPKSGRKMPAVKLLYQESEGNTKPRYIMGHSVQVVSMLVAAAGSFFAVPRRSARGCAPSGPVSRLPSSSPPRRCATRSRNFSQTQIPARYSRNSSATASTPHATSLCGSPDR